MLISLLSVPTVNKIYSKLNKGYKNLERERREKRENLAHIPRGEEDKQKQMKERKKIKGELGNGHSREGDVASFLVATKDGIGINLSKKKPIHKAESVIEEFM